MLRNTEYSTFLTQYFNYYSIDAPLDMALYWVVHPWINSNFITNVLRCIKEGDLNTFQSVSAAQYRVSNFFKQHFKYYSIDAELGLNMALYWVMHPWINSNFIANVLRCIKGGDLNTFQSVSASILL